MRATIKYFILLLVLGTPFFVPAQNYKTGKEDIIKMNEKYAKARSYSMSIKVKVYQNKSAAYEAITYSGSVKKSPDGMWTSMNKLTTLLNKDCSVIVDENQKLIVYGKGSAKALKVQSEVNFSPFLDSMLYKHNKVEFYSADEGQKVYRITTPTNQLYDYVDISIAKDSYILKSVTYYYKKSNDLPYSKVEIEYSNVEINPKLPLSLFSEKKYVENHNGKLSPVKTYASYKVIDSTKKVSTEFKK